MCCIRNCVPCLLSNRKSGLQEGFLMPIEKGEVPLDTYHIDYLGPMTMTNKNYKHLFCVIGSFSKFVWLYPTKSTTTSEAIDRLTKQQKTFGNPRRIIADAGSCFTSNDFKNYCEDQNIELHIVTTGVPRGNGQIEIVNKIIIPILTKLSLENPSNWYKYVDATQRYLNCTFNRAVGRSPFEVLIGARMRNKDDIRISEVIEKELVEMFIDKRSTTRDDCRRQISKIQEENKKTYNRGRKKCEAYEEGDVVAVKRSQFGPGLKIHTGFLGPYKVTKKKRNHRYQVEKIGTHEGPYKTSTSADNMKPWSSSFRVVSNDEVRKGRVGFNGQDGIPKERLSEKDVSTMTSRSLEVNGFYEEEK